MKVENIIKNAAEILELKDVQKYLDDGTGSDEVLADIQKILTALNMTNTNIASNYMPIYQIKTIESTEEFIEFKQISTLPIVEFRNITSNNKKLAYKILSNGIKVANGTIDIEFAYLPAELKLDSEIDYYKKLNELVFAYGVVSEYLYITGIADEAYNWNVKFKQMIFALTRTKRMINIKERRWK